MRNRTLPDCHKACPAPPAPSRLIDSGAQEAEESAMLSDRIAADIPPLPTQPADVPWPTRSWARGTPPGPDIERLANDIFDLTGPQGVTYALLVVHRGALVYERYAHGASPFYLQYSWSMAKSVVQALVGILVDRGVLDP